MHSSYHFTPVIKNTKKNGEMDKYGMWFLWRPFIGQIVVRNECEDNTFMKNCSCKYYEVWNDVNMNYMNNVNMNLRWKRDNILLCMSKKTLCFRFNSWLLILLSYTWIINGEI